MLIPHRLLLYATLFVAFVCVHNDLSLSPSAAQAISEGEVSTALDTMNYVLENTKKYVEKQKKKWEDPKTIMDAALREAKVADAIGLARAISSMMTAVSAAGALASFIFTFFVNAPDPMDALHKRFDEVRFDDNVINSLGPARCTIMIDVSFSN